ncbi:MAG: excinuclease ABC subunit UvrB [Candidatus Magasanikbacteria bacterium]
MKRKNKKFQLEADFKPAGDQPKAIEELVDGINKGYEHQTLLGATGTGKTFTVANVIEQIQKPTLYIAHNKTLAAQLCNELRELFPHNAVEYFVSYYDYYQPEAYVPTTDTYIGKEAMINDEVDKLRHSATTSLLTRKDVIVVSSVSCIYGLGAPKSYEKHIVNLEKGEKIDRQELTKELVRIQFERTNSDLKRGTFRLKGNTLEIMPTNQEVIYTIDLNKDDKIEEIFLVDPVKGFQIGKTPTAEVINVAPAQHFITEKPEREEAIKKINKELQQRLKELENEGKHLEAERLERRTKNDIAMIREVGYCSGIENYSIHLSDREPGDPPATLIDYFPDDFLTVIDESHVTVPQIGGMFAGDRSRKETLVEHGFRLPSALENRPLKFEEFEEKTDQTIYTSATPDDYEKEVSEKVVEQIIRPTGLVDPKVTIEPARGQVDDLIEKIEGRIEQGDRVLVTTLTKKMAEDLTDYLQDDKEMSVAYIHSGVDTIDRIKILTKLRKGDYDIVVGVNLLREGLDLPEVSLVAILDADKEGFLRSETSLIQVIGRAARNVRGEVVLYADEITGSIEAAVEETERRRKKQIEYNEKHDIEPETIDKEISDIAPIEMDEVLELENKPLPEEGKDIEKLIEQKEKEMEEAADNLDFELAAALRDEIKELMKQKSESDQQPAD